MLKTKKEIGEIASFLFFFIFEWLISKWISATTNWFVANKKKIKIKTHQK